MSDRSCFLWLSLVDTPTFERHASHGAIDPICAAWRAWSVHVMSILAPKTATWSAESAVPLSIDEAFAARSPTLRPCCLQ